MDVTDGKNEREFIRFCGELIFGDGAARWAELSPAQREAFCQLAQKAGWETLFAYVLKEKLPEPFFRNFCAGYQREMLKRLMESRKLAQFYQLLESEKIPFIPIKGADLAFRIYPDDALRQHGDWDVLFHREDCPRVLRLLQERGWKTPSGYAPRETWHWHYEVLNKDHCNLEVHRILPNFWRATEDEIWRETEPVTEYRRILTPEMNLLLLSAHASSQDYLHVPQRRLLLDAGMILKHDAVDWEKVHQLADRWGILRPDVLLHVWNGFFPKGVLPPEEPESEAQRLIREIFATRNAMYVRNSYERAVGIQKSHNLRWLKKYLRFYTAPLICKKYHIPPHQHAKILWYGIRDFLEKSWFVLTYRRSANDSMREYAKLVARLDELTTGKRNPDASCAEH